MKKDKALSEFRAAGWTIVHEADSFGSLLETQFEKEFGDGAACVSLTEIEDKVIWSVSIVMRIGRERVSELVRIRDFGAVRDVEAFVMERASAMRPYVMGRVSEIDLTKPPASRFTLG